MVVPWAKAASPGRVDVERSPPAAGRGAGAGRRGGRAPRGASPGAGTCRAGLTRCTLGREGGWLGMEGLKKIG
ncbi:hypothetical protein JYU34_015154 [Plutella xylostella]|uniref:Uncharacterized protein n=1 Tax=Plutella xylostella TaxID=51655 RepID=A0ABQ7QA51_PLUXY|nr:hypothetical protein JYU34_015154 [Plutella xylostella]